MADKLTPQQAQAVQNRGGRLLVSAAAGSGKTKVLVDRLLSYLTEERDPANLDEFLIITYTNAAAAELRAKIAAKLTERIAAEPENRHLQKQMQRLYLTKISTVHGFCGDLIREYAYRLDVAADFRVADENECRELRDNCLKDLLDRAYETIDEDPDFRAFVDTQGLGRDDSLVPELIESVYNSAMCHLDPQGWLQKCVADADVEGVADAGDTVWGRFLLKDLKDYLRCQIAAWEKCARLLEACPGMEKPAANLWGTCHQLENLAQAETWDEVCAGREIGYGTLRFPTKNPDPEISEQIKALRQEWKKKLEKKLSYFSDTSQQILGDMAQSAAGVRGLVKLVEAFSRDYAAAKRSRRVLDFGDLEHRCLDLLLGKNRGGPTALAAEVGRRYREIMVDEYQDSNGVQDAIFDALTREKQNCFLVGDVKQSIYRFRLADPGIFLEKYQTYTAPEKAQTGQGRKVLLSHNFRSGPEVIEAVNDVFRTCMRPEVGGLVYGEGEALREGVPHEVLPDPAVELHVLKTDGKAYAEEAAFVADEIEKMLRSRTLVRKDGGLRPVEPDDIVILLRAFGGYSENTAAYFERALAARGIRSTSGGGTDLLKTPEVGTLRAILQTVLNPRQDIPLLCALLSPVFAFTADDLAALRARQKQGTIYDALLSWENEKGRRFLDILSRLRADSRRSSLTALLEQVFTLTRLDSIYGSLPDGKARSANLQAFFQLAAGFEGGSLRDLSQFLYHLDALERKGLTAAGASGTGCVTIMTIHRSKGLEFPVVFLCNLSRSFNREELKNPILCDRDLGLGLTVADARERIRYPSLAKNAIAVKLMRESVSEELRVLYVAMTRARDRLIMTYAASDADKVLKQAALGLDFDGGELWCREALCLGDWVLLAAVGRTEAGQLHNLGGRPLKTTLSVHPWKITARETSDAGREISALTETLPSMPEDAMEKLRAAVSFRYPHLAATQAPSKQTATDRKGRFKDAEAAENAREPGRPQLTWRKPELLTQKQAGKAYGSAIHAALQYIRYEACENEAGVSREIARLVAGGYLTREQGELVNCRKLAAFFVTELGQKLRGGVPCIREFKFSILDDGRHYGQGLEGEQVLLQGVVDCALVEEDGITILDFKTDYVTEETLEKVISRYRPQVEVYGEALSRIYEKPIKGKFLYFFHLDRFEAV